MPGNVEGIIGGRVSLEVLRYQFISTLEVNWSWEFLNACLKSKSVAGGYQNVRIEKKCKIKICRY